MGCPLIEAAVKIVSGDDRRTALGVFISGTVIGIVTALDAGTRTTGFDELDVVVVAQANTTLRVAVSTGTSAGVVLASCVARVQPIDCLGTDTPSDCKSEVGMRSRGGVLMEGKSRQLTLGEASSVGSVSGLELDISPEVGRKYTLPGRVFAVR